MTTLGKRDVLRLTNFVRNLEGFEILPRGGACYAHMGATICDAILQAGLNYRTVVGPRVQRLIHNWPSATVTSRFLAMVSLHGLNEVLNWNHPEKPTRIGHLTEFLVTRDVETEQDLAQWLIVEANSLALKELRGVGPKTIDYLKSLVGLPAVAVDRHVRTFVGMAGIRSSGYAEIRDLVSSAADLLHVEQRALDHAIWEYVAAQARIVRLLDGQRRSDAPFFRVVSRIIFAQKVAAPATLLTDRPTPEDSPAQPPASGAILRDEGAGSRLRVRAGLPPRGRFVNRR